MKLAHKVKITVFCKQGEDEKSIRETLLSLVPFNPEQEKLALRETNAAGFQETRIKILELDLEKEKHTNLFLENLKENLNIQQKEMLLRQLNSRLDDDLYFYIRLDKDRLLKDEFCITDSGNCFHIKISIAAFPSKRETAIGIVRKIFAS